MQYSITNRSQTDNRNHAVVRSLFERIYSKGELSRIDEVVTPDFTGESTESPHRFIGPAGLKSHVLRLRTTFYAFTMVINELHVRDDAFTVSWTARGTQEQRFQGVDPMITIGQVGEEPHGSLVTVSGETTGVIRDGRIHESRMVWNVAERDPQINAATEGADSKPSAAGRPRSRSVLLGELPVPPTGSRTGGR